MTKDTLTHNLVSSEVFKDLLNRISSYDDTGFPIYTSPLYGCTKSLLVKKLFEKERVVLVLQPDEKSAAEFNVELNVLGLSKDILLIDEIKSELLQEKLTEINQRKKFILISTYDILSCLLPDKNKIEQKTTKIQIGGELSYDDLIEYLNLLIYTKDKFVEAPGYYSQRGSIIDFWSYSEKNPVRLEYDGDFLESIRYFDPESQRSIDKIESVTLAAKINQQLLEENHSNIFDYLNDPVVIASSYDLNSFAKQQINPFTEEEFGESEESIEESTDEDIPEISELNISVKLGNGNIEANDFVNGYKVRWIIEEEIASNNNRVELGFTPAPTINSNYEVLFKTLSSHTTQNFDIVITVENELQETRLRDLLSEFKQELAELIESGKIKIVTFAVKEGFINKEEKFLLLTDYQIFNKPYRTKIATSKKFKRAKSKTFASIKKGDYVVHEDYGIGKYAGLETIKIGETLQESMKILYSEGGVVYVNLNYLTLVKKYSSNENLVPTLSTLGTGEWQNTKAKTKKKIKEAARELIELYAKRKASKGFQFSNDTVWQKELEASFFYEDTPDQAKATDDVKLDMEAENPMDRLVCGDVGFGKTEVAVRAAFKAVQDGKQVAILVPTTILAEQHYNTFTDRLTQFPLRVAALSRFQTRKEQTEIVQNLDQGQVDIVIGTHRLLSKDIKFKDLGLLIIDEEHRFGVKSKEKLKSIKVNVDTLTLTATPIPRTLNLSLLGARDLSIIATPPPNRQPIYTTVSTFDMTKIREWILNELKRSGQVYVVHDRVHSIDRLAGYINKYVPEAKLAIAHGQMKPSQLEDVIHGFLNKKYDVLLSTKIIESGIDIPNVNTIIVNRADRFGLAELHQLRGRVGRSDRQAYAYFIVPSMSGITKKALRRLQAIEEFTEIGAGFNLSMRDLEIRGAGNLLGTEQTGFINDVGFDLYVKMINQAVEELKYQEFKEVFRSLPKQKERTEPTIDTFFDIGIPDTYVLEQAERLNYYTELYSIEKLEEISEIIEEMKDRFGPLPSIVQRLIETARLRFYASYALFERIIIQRKNIFIILPKGENEEYYKYKFIELMRFIMDEYKNEIKFVQQKEVMKLTIENKFTKPEEILSYLLEFCNRTTNLFDNYLPAVNDKSSSKDNPKAR
jgi:transcription-repair coupling factor (superfamily II helicase)